MGLPHKVLDYTSSAQFDAIDATKVAFSASGASLLDRRPATALFYAKLASSFNGNWGNGSLATTLVDPDVNNPIALVSGMMKFPGSIANQYWLAPGAGNMTGTSQIGTIIFDLKTNYSGTPTYAQAFAGQFNIPENGASALSIEHQTNGNLYVAVRNSVGTQVIASSLGVWAPTAGTVYRMALCWNFTSGSTQLFVGAGSATRAQFGSTIVSTLTRSEAHMNYLISGRTYNTTSAYRPNFSIGRIAVFNTKLFSANFEEADEPTFTDTIFATDLPSVVQKVAEQVNTTRVRMFTETATKPTGTNIKYIVDVDGSRLYHNGTTWIASTGASGEMNTADELNLHAEELDLSTERLFRVEAFLFSNTAGDITPTLRSIDIVYVPYLARNQALPDRCTLAGFIEDLVGPNVTDFKLLATPRRGFMHSQVYIPAKPVEADVSTDTGPSGGYIEMVLAETESVHEVIDFTATYTQNGAEKTEYFHGKIIPNQELVDIASFLKPEAKE